MAQHDGLVAHHFDDLEQQNESLVLGMWLFLASEVMFFGGLFCAYIVYRTRFPEAWHAGSDDLNLVLGTFNTFALLCSSLTMALSVRSAQLGRKNQLVLFLLSTLVLGCIFLGVKAVEYSAKFAHHTVPGAGFEWHGAGSPENVQLFFVLYFIMTGMHAFHMIIGLGGLAILLVMALMGRFNEKRFMGVELFGLYWHLVDIIWVFLFPLLYLIDRT